MACIPERWNCWTSINNKAAIICTSTKFQPILVHQSVSTVTIKLTLDEAPLNIISAYCPPPNHRVRGTQAAELSDISITLDELDNVLRSIHPENSLIGADLNAHSIIWSYPSEDSRGEQVLDFILANNLFLMNSQYSPPTFINKHQQGWPDLTLVTNPNMANVTTWEVLDDETLSDHKYIKITLNCKTSTFQFKRFKTKFGGHGKFCHLLKPLIPDLSHTISTCNNTADLERATISLQKAITSCCSSSFKLKTQSYETRTPTWWSQTLQMERKQLRALRRRYQSSSSPEKEKYYKIYKAKRAAYFKQIRLAKKKTWKEFCSSAKDPYGKIYKVVFKKTVPPAYLFVDSHRTPLGSELNIAQDILERLFPTTSSHSFHPTISSKNDVPFSRHEIERTINSLKKGKAPGYDGIDNIVIQTIHRSFPNILLSFFNKCLELSYFPRCLKVGLIILFHKEGRDKSSIDSYRPISLLPTLGKVLEKLTTKRFTFHLETNKLLSDFQFGFRQGQSVVTP